MTEADVENEALVRAYHVVFGSPDGQIVLADLEPFCRAIETCFHVDPRQHALLEGRREVWLRIQKLSRLTAEQILNLNTRRARVQHVPSGEDDD